MIHNIKTVIVDTHGNATEKQPVKEIQAAVVPRMGEYVMTGGTMYQVTAVVHNDFEIKMHMTQTVCPP